MQGIIIELLQTLAEFTNTAHRNCWYLPSALQVNKSIVQIINSPFYSHLTRSMFTWQRMESRLLLARSDVWFIGFFATVYFQCLHSSWHESFWTNDHDCRPARNPFPLFMFTIKIKRIQKIGWHLIQASKPALGCFTTFEIFRKGKRLVWHSNIIICDIKASAETVRSCCNQSTLL